MIDQSDRLPTVDDVRERYGLDEDLAGSILRASGGHDGLIRAALGAVGSTGRSLPELLESGAMADYVVSGVTDVAVVLGGADQHALEILSLLECFDDDVARIALEAVSEGIDDFAWTDISGTVLRLQMAGAIIVAEERSVRMVPVLLAAWARRLWTERESASSVGDVARILAVALTDQMELAKSPDRLVVDNAVDLARRTRSWSLLDRIFLTCGYPLFFRYPRNSASAFAHLPPAALRAIPELDEVTEVATALHDSVIVAGSHRESRLREEVARLTGPRVLVPGGSGKAAPGNVNGGVLIEEDADPSSRFHAVVAQMHRSAAAGDHAGAAEAGASWVATGLGRRSKAIVRLEAGRHSLLAGAPGRTLALLRSVEDEVRESSTAGSYLAPAVTAWSALAAYLTGDAERADAELMEFAALDVPPLVQEAWFRPAALVAQAYRHLDRLELRDAENVMERIREFPSMGELWVHLPIIERVLAQLTSPTRSVLLRADESVRMRSSSTRPNAVSAGGAGDEMLAASQIGMLIGLGRLHRAEALLEVFSGPPGIGQVLLARSELIASRVRSALNIAETQYHENAVDTRQRAELTGVRSVALLRNGDIEGARRSFSELLDLSVWVGSLLPVVLVPIGDRVRLLDLVGHSAVHRQIGGAFPDVDGTSAWEKLRTLAPALVAEVDFPALGQREMMLLEQLDRGLSVAEMAKELLLVEGTVKNNLSSLYRKLGVGGREAAVVRARALGYLGGGEG